MNGVWMGWVWFWPTLLLLGVVVIAGVLVWWARDQRPSSPEGSRGAREILDERFARGEIDEDEYRRRRAELR